MARIIVIALAFICLMTGYPTIAVGQTVSVMNDDRGRGYGFMFSHGGNCYVAMPRHVAGLDFYPRVNLATAAPIVTGTGRMIRPFWDGIDLALAVASEALRPRCTASLDDLQPSRSAQTATSALLLRLRADGSEDRTPIAIEDRNYISFTGLVDPGDGEITQGTSGAFAFVRGEPIGMAITSDQSSRALFMRAEEIHMNVGRFLAQSGGAATEEKADPVPSAAPGQLPLVLVSSSVPAIEPSLAPENMIGEGVFVFRPAGPMIFDFRFEPEQSTVLSGISLTAPADGGYAVPKSILIQTSNTAAGETFRTLLRRQISPDGQFDSGDLAGRFVRRLRIIVLDTWSNGPVAIEQITAR